MYTKLFEVHIKGFFQSFFGKETPKVLEVFDLIIFLFSLGYQINYWLL
jgi:hypothetical protein